MGLPTTRAYSTNPAHGIANDGLGLPLRLPAGNQRHPPGVGVVARGVGLRNSQMAGVQIHPDDAVPPVGSHGYFSHIGGG